MEKQRNVLKYDSDMHAQQNDLRLRQRFPYLKTTLYRVDSPFCHVILCENYIGDFKELKRIFEGEIRRFTIPTELVNKEPDNYITVVKNITDKDLWDISGMAFTKNDLNKILKERFPDIDIIKIGKIKAKTREIEVVISKNILDHRKEVLQRFLDSLDDFVVWKIIMEQPNDKLIEERFFRKNDNLNMIVERDNTFFYDNIKKIYSGDFCKKNFFFMDENKFNCFVDYTYSNSTNLRFMLLFYDVVYMKLPVKQSLREFLKAQLLTEEQFYSFLQSGRILVVLPSILKDEIDLRGVINDYPVNGFLSDKMVSSLVLSDLKKMSDNYLFNKNEISTYFLKNCDKISSVANIPGEKLKDIILWPKKALMNTTVLNYENSLKSIGFFGVNTILQDDIAKKVGKDVQLEFMMFSQNVHISSALDATYFPFVAENGFSDDFYATIMSEYLNFFKCFNLRYLKNYANVEIQRKNSIFQIDLLNYFELNTYDDVFALEEIYNSRSIRNKGRAFMEELSLLDRDERLKKIKILDEKVQKELEKEKRLKKTLDLTGLLPMDPFFSFMLRILDTLNKNRKYKVIDNWLSRFEDLLELNGEGRDVHFLRKINKVAKIKRGFKY